MIDQDLLKFVTTQSKLGSSREMITDLLTAQGWAMADIDQAFAAIDPAKKTPIFVPNPETSLKKPGQGGVMPRTALQEESAKILSGVMPVTPSVQTPAMPPVQNQPRPIPQPNTPVSAVPQTQFSPTPAFTGPMTAPVQQGQNIEQVQPKSSGDSKTILIILACLVLVVAGAGTFYYFVIMPKISPTNALDNASNNSSDSNSNSQTNTQTPSISASLNSANSVSRATYESLLANTISAEDAGVNGTSTTAGPALLKINGNVIDIFLPKIPNITNSRAVSISIDKILAAKNKDINDATSTLEANPAFTNITLASVDDPHTPFEGNRNLNIQNGHKPSEIKSITGALTITLPVNAKTLTLTKLNLNTAQKVIYNGTSTTLALNTIGSTVILSCLPIGPCFDDMTATNATGTVVKYISNSSTNSHGRSAYTYRFNDTVTSVTLLIPESQLTETYPFTLQK